MFEICNVKERIEASEPKNLKLIDSCVLQCYARKKSFLLKMLIKAIRANSKRKKKNNSIPYKAM